MFLQIKSHPLYEDVNWNICRLDNKDEVHGHPLYEDVNWNYVVNRKIQTKHVILYMRMWIEMPLGRSKRQAAASSSIWGCELKYSIKAEIRNQFRSSSIWGCELKFVVGTVGEKTLVILYMRMWIEIERGRGGAGGKRSASIWGCELKYECWCEVQSLASHPLYEDVNWNPATSWVPLSLPCHPLYEDVNWNRKLC